MDIAKKLYRFGWTANELLQVTLESWRSTSGLTGHELTQQLKHQKNELSRLYESTAKNNGPSDKAMFERETKEHNDCIDSVNKQCKDIISRLLIDSGYLAFGYYSIDDPTPILIPAHEWAFLSLNYADSSASFQDRTYTAIKFVPTMELKSLSSDELKQLSQHTKPGKDREKIARSGVPAPKTSEQLKSKTITRRDNLKIAMASAINSFSRKPSFVELWEYFQNDKDETGIIEDFTEEKITWRTSKGKLTDSTKKAVMNRLSKMDFPA